MTTESETATLVGPGAQLRQARADLKLTPEEVARTLHLSLRQIEAIESDDFDALAGPTYVRGYLRAYAQLLGLSAERVLDAYSRSTVVRKPVDLAKLAPKPEIHSDHRLIKLAIVVVVVIVLGLSAVWWVEQAEITETVADPITAPATVAAPVVASLDAPVEVPNPAEPPASHSTEFVANEAAPAVVPETATVTRRIAAPASDGERVTLLLHADADCWASVHDALGNRLFYELIAAGRSVSLEGAAPLAVHLGNAEGVRLEVNGQDFDISAYRHKQYLWARFTVPARARP